MKSRAVPFVLLVCLLALTSLTGCRLFRAETPVDAPTIAPATLAPTAVVPPAAPSPTATPSPPPPPTPTLDPNLPEWTILIYMAADNNLDAQALANLNQLESAGSSPDVNVIVQIDRAADQEWSETRRLQIQADGDRQVVQSPIVEAPGELNSGEPGVLADFLAWGLARYPAQKTALILWNHGIGWSGIAIDDSSRDVLTLPELAAALEWGLASSPGTKLDLIGFDACLMGQLDVLAAVAPYARVAVASEELIPADGWAYEAWLGSLIAEPSQSGVEAAGLAVDTFMTSYRETNPFVTLSAVDLERLPAVVDSLQGLAAVLEESPSPAAADLITARHGAELFARAYGVGVDRYAAIDLRHLAKILQERALTEPLAAAADRLAAAIDQAIIRAGQGSGYREANGIALYVPSDPDPVQLQLYGEATVLPGWSTFLNRLRDRRQDENAPPAVTTVNSIPEEPASALAPAHLAFQVTGREIAEVTLFAGRYEEDGRRQLFEIDRLIPEPTFLADGSRLFTWRDGLHEDFYIWDTQATFLTDGNEGQYVVMWPLDQDQQEPGRPPFRSLPGLYTRAATGEAIRVNLLFDTASGSIGAIWGVTADQAPFELQAAAGDFFQPDRLFIEAGDQIVSEPGVTLRLSDAAQLSFDRRPLPSGPYFIGFAGSNSAGQSSLALVDLPVDNTILAGNSVAYLDPYLGFQFYYPSGWYRPVYRDRVLFTTSRDGRTRLRLTLFPDVSPASPQALKEETLKIFGPVEVLYEESTTLAGRPSEMVAYGYIGSDGEHTGLLGTFVHDGTGYVIDLDGPQTEEATLLETWRTLQASWRYRPVGRGLFPNRWSVISTADFSLPKPETFLYQPAENGWQRFSAPDDSQTFVALRLEPGDEQTGEAALDRWVAVAAGGVDQFQAGGIGRFVLGSRLWIRHNFTYNDRQGEAVRGFIMTARVDDGVIVAWVEAPARRYDAVEHAIFEVMLAELN